MRERQSICCCETHNLGHKTGVEKKNYGKGSQRGGGGMHERNSSSMAWALKNDTEETAEYNSRDGRRRPGEVPRKKT